MIQFTNNSYKFRYGQFYVGISEEMTGVGSKEDPTARVLIYNRDKLLLDTLVVLNQRWGTPARYKGTVLTEDLFPILKPYLKSPVALRLVLPENLNNELNNRAVVTFLPHK